MASEETTPDVAGDGNPATAEEWLNRHAHPQYDYTPPDENMCEIAAAELAGQRHETRLTRLRMNVGLSYERLGEWARSYAREADRLDEENARLSSQLRDRTGVDGDTSEEKQTVIDSLAGQLRDKDVRIADLERCLQGLRGMANRRHDENTALRAENTAQDVILQSYREDANGDDFSMRDAAMAALDSASAWQLLYERCRDSVKGKP